MRPLGGTANFVGFWNAYNQMPVIPAMTNLGKIRDV
jgi:hypothetical protein